MQIIPFQPPPDGAFVFQPILDGVPYRAIVTWNLWGYGSSGIEKRPYLNLYTLQGELLLCTAMVGSPVGYDISLIPPAMNLKSAIVYRIDNQNIEVT